MNWDYAANLKLIAKTFAGTPSTNNLFGQKRQFRQPAIRRGVSNAEISALEVSDVAAPDAVASGLAVPGTAVSDVAVPDAAISSV